MGGAAHDETAGPWMGSEWATDGKAAARAFAFSGPHVVMLVVVGSC